MLLVSVIQQPFFEHLTQLLSTVSRNQEYYWIVQLQLFNNFTTRGSLVAKNRRSILFVRSVSWDLARFNRCSDVPLTAYTADSARNGWSDSDDGRVCRHCCRSVGPPIMFTLLSPLAAMYTARPTRRHFLILAAHRPWTPRIHPIMATLPLVPLQHASCCRCCSLCLARLVPRCCVCVAYYKVLKTVLITVNSLGPFQLESVPDCCHSWNPGWSHSCVVNHGKPGQWRHSGGLACGELQQRVKSG